MYVDVCMHTVYVCNTMLKWTNHEKYVQNPKRGKKKMFSLDSGETSKI